MTLVIFRPMVSPKACPSACPKACPSACFREKIHYCFAFLLQCEQRNLHHQRIGAPSERGSGKSLTWR